MPFFTLMDAFSAGTQTFAQTTSSNIVDIEAGSICPITYYVQCNVTLATPANKTFVDANVSVANDTVTINGHPYLVGQVVTLTTSGTLPGGLATATTYYLIIVDANTIAFATSLVNANAGTKIDITSAAGGGTHTVTVTALAGGTAQLQSSIDKVGFFNEGSSQNITATTTLAFEQAQTPPGRFYKVVYTLTAGSLTTTTLFHTKG